jgi:hypothetical protein
MINKILQNKTFIFFFADQSLSKFCSFENFGLVFVPDKAQFEDVASRYVRKTATQYGAKNIKKHNYNKF